MISHFTFPMVLPEQPTNTFHRCDAYQTYSFSQGPWHADVSHDNNHLPYDHENNIGDTLPDPHQQFSPHAFEWDVTDRLVAHTRAAAPAVAPWSSNDKTCPVDTNPQRPDSATSRPKKRPSKTRARRPSGSRKTLTPLPDDFEPSNYSVMCGQGNEYFHAVGTLHLGHFFATVPRSF